MEQHRLFHIQLPLAPGWDAIEPLRASVLACVDVVFPHGSLGSGIGLVTAELVENAVKHGRWGEAEGFFALRVDGHPDRIEIEVSNPVGHADPRVDRLLAELARIANAPSPQEAYVKAMRGLALGKEAHLGLSRVAHEGGCDLSADVDASSVRVRAVTRQLAPPSPIPAAPA